jgi:hypothetical protein
MKCKGAAYFDISDRTSIAIKNQQGVKQKLKAASGTSSKSDLFNLCTFIPPQTVAIVPLKGLSHEIFRPVFWPVWIYLGLNGNRFWFFNFKEGSLIFDSYFKY